MTKLRTRIKTAEPLTVGMTFTIAGCGKAVDGRAVFGGYDEFGTKCEAMTLTRWEVKTVHDSEAELQIASRP